MLPKDCSFFLTLVVQARTEVQNTHSELFLPQEWAELQDLIAWLLSCKLWLPYENLLKGDNFLVTVNYILKIKINADYTVNQELSGCPL